MAAARNAGRGGGSPKKAEAKAKANPFATEKVGPYQGMPEDLLESGAQVQDVMITGFKVPDWMEMLFDVSGLSLLQYKIEAEREERGKDTYQNPYPEVFQVVSSLKFECFIGGMIMLNCFLIGLEASQPPGSGDAAFAALENIFVLLFLCEWLMRIRAFGWIWVFEPVNAADTAMVWVFGVLPKWVFGPAGMDVSFLRIFTVLRALRLARLAKAVRLEPGFRELWMLIHGLSNSARPLLWTWVIAILILYIFAVAATELIGRQSEFKDDEHIQELFGNPMRSMFTMFQLMTLDTWAYTIARPVMAKQFGMCLFFIAFIFLGVFVFWNLITAIIVENAMKVASEDAGQKAKDMDETKKRELKALADLFLEIDKDGSGELTVDEFFSALENPKVKRMIDLLDLKVSEMKDVWIILDDGDGLLTIKEFSNGLRRMKGEAKAKDIIDVIKKLRHTSLYHTELRSQVDSFGHTMRGLEEDINAVATDTSEALGLFHEIYHRLQHYIDRCEREDQAGAAERQRVIMANLVKANVGTGDDEDGDDEEVEDEEEDSVDSTEDAEDPMDAEESL
mmetsp:Transcript_31846/g.94679  ORF Transcript_31846/g.94679 Transcript_31846/m.94679 type:complete len:565 (+) Transcript_31846:54-1748(+)